MVGAHQPDRGLGEQLGQRDPVDEVQRVQRVALGLGHLLAVGVAHQRIDVDVAERHLAGEVQRHHDHPGDPEEDDVKARDEDRGGQERLEVLRLLRPAERREGHEGGGEPGVEHVLVAFQRAGAAFRGSLLYRFFLGARNVDMARVVVPGRDLVAPPELPGDAPVLDVLQPVVVGAGPVVRVELHVAVGDGLEPGLREPLGLHEPLVREHGFHHHAGAAPLGHDHLVRFGGDEEPVAFELRDHGLARVVAVHAAELRGPVLVDLRVEREDDDQREVVADRRAIVVEVVRAGDLDAAGAEIRLDEVVRDDGDRALAQRQDHALADEVLVARVLRVHGHGAVGEHRLRSGGGDGYAAQRDGVAFLVGRGLRAVGERIEDLPHRAGGFLAVDLEVGDGGAEHRIPVDQALAPVDQAFLVEAHEHFRHGARHFRVHREIARVLPFGICIRPVGRIAEAPHLARDGRAGFLLPLPHALDELLAPEVVPRLAGGLQLALDDDLRGNAGVVGADHPVGVVPEHAVVSHQRVHQRLLEGVTHVQRAGDVGRRQLDAVRGGAGLVAGREVALGLPVCVPATLDGMGVETLVEGH